VSRDEDTDSLYWSVEPRVKIMVRVMDRFKFMVKGYVIVRVMVIDMGMVKVKVMVMVKDMVIVMEG
jgi:hypothetical protein